MSKALKTIQVIPGSELDRLLEEAAEMDILLEKEGVHYRLKRVHTPDTDDTAPEQDPEIEPERVLNIIGLGKSRELLDSSNSPARVRITPLRGSQSDDNALYKH